jgi:hypothetical protein
MILWSIIKKHKKIKEKDIFLENQQNIKNNIFSRIVNGKKINTEGYWSFFLFVCNFHGYFTRIHSRSDKKIELN